MASVMAFGPSLPLVKTSRPPMNLIDSEDLQRGSPSSCGNAVVPDTARETFITLLQWNLEFQLLVVLRCDELDIGKGIAEVHGRAEDCVVDRDEGCVLVAVEVFKR